MQQQSKTNVFFFFHIVKWHSTNVNNTKKLTTKYMKLVDLNEVGLHFKVNCIGLLLS